MYINNLYVYNKCFLQGFCSPPRVEGTHRMIYVTGSHKGPYGHIVPLGLGEYMWYNGRAHSTYIQLRYLQKY